MSERRWNFCVFAFYLQGWCQPPWDQLISPFRSHVFHWHELDLLYWAKILGLLLEKLVHCDLPDNLSNKNQSWTFINLLYSSCIEYCSHCFCFPAIDLEIFNIIQRWICKVIGHNLASRHQKFFHSPNLDSLCHFLRQFF